MKRILNAFSMIGVLTAAVLSLFSFTKPADKFTVTYGVLSSDANYYYVETLPAAGQGNSGGWRCITKLDSSCTVTTNAVPDAANGNRIAKTETFTNIEHDKDYQRIP